MEKVNAAKAYRIGIDVGGTFTDVVLVSEATGDILVTKVPSIPDDPSQACVLGLEKALRVHALSSEQVGFVVHGTTVATNAIIEGKAGSAGLLTTEGFRDVLEIAYQTRPSLYDVFYDKPKPLVPRYRCLGIPERLGPEGEVLEPLNEQAVRSAARALKADGVEAIAVAFLHSYRNSDHEQRAGEILIEECPDIPIVLSSQVCPEFREYPRTSTAVVNAVLMPRISPYIRRFVDGFVERGVRRQVYLMTSSGGIVTADVARNYPVRLIESGPAAGVIGAAFVARLAGFDHVLALDIGGTTAKAAIISGGEPQISDQFEVGAQAVASVTAHRGQGYPVRTPAISLMEIGAGGGSIAHVDPGGALTVGPHSAGADPGPVCYSQGGLSPTLTDANLVLGRINPDFFLGGEQALDKESSRSVIKDQLSDPLGVAIEEAALNVVDIANAKMISALYFISVQQGVDPRNHVLVASGGAGPMQAAAIAQGLEVKQVLIPPTPGLNSALGLLSADLKHEVVRTYMRPAAVAEEQEMRATLREMRSDLEDLLSKEGVSKERITSSSIIETLYVGQSYPLKIEVDLDDSTSLIEQAACKFQEMHRAAYGFADPDEPVQFVNLRQLVVGAVNRPRLRELQPSVGSSEQARKSSRQVYFGQGHGWLDASIYDRQQLRWRHAIEGPAIIEQMDTTTVLPPATVATVDRMGNLLIEVPAGK